MILFLVKILQVKMIEEDSILFSCLKRATEEEGLEQRGGTACRHDMEAGDGEGRE
jgi:hypothetical protein